MDKITVNPHFCARRRGHRFIQTDIWLTVIVCLSCLVVSLPSLAQVVLPTYREFTVDTLSDDLNPAGCSLREAVESINTGGNVGGCLATSRPGDEFDTIRFSPTVLPGQIFLTDRLLVEAGLRLLGPEDGTLEISGSNLVQLMLISNQSPGVALRNLHLTQGFSSNNGGGISALAPLVVSNSVISQCESMAVGGGIIAAGGLTLDNVVLEDNLAGDAGAVYSIGPLQISDSIFSGNTATGVIDGGGALWVDHGGADPVQKNVSATRFSGNEAPNGGAVLVSNTGDMPTEPLIIETSTFENNRATAGRGSAVMQKDGSHTVVIRRSLLVDSMQSVAETQIDQEGVPSDTARLQLVNSTVVGNDGLRANSQLDLRSVTMVLTTPQAGTALEVSPGRTARIRDSILLSEGGADCLGAMANIVENENNVFFTSTCAQTGANVITDDAQLGPLQDNGGATLTMAPLPGSPVIDAGSIFCPADDQRGAIRSDGACDIGAVEAGPSDALFSDGFEQP
ncbi:MAG: choice-of-anchor Q domain-containing protein [Pseudomonadota bacterium]